MFLTLCCWEFLHLHWQREVITYNTVCQLPKIVSCCVADIYPLCVSYKLLITWISPVIRLICLFFFLLFHLLSLMLYFDNFMYFSIVDQTAARLQIKSMLHWLYFFAPWTTSEYIQAWVISGKTFGHLWPEASFRLVGNEYNEFLK